MTPIESPASPLAGRCIALPETRELEVFAGLLERRGARVWRCPLVAIKDAPDPAPVLHWLHAFIAGGCDDLVLLTGEGLRRLDGCLQHHAPQHRTAFRERLALTRLIARGPKPGRVLRDWGMKAQHVADPATTPGLIALLQQLDAQQPLRGRRIGVQRYGTEPNRPLSDALTALGAREQPVAPYIYADAADQQAVQALIAALAAGTVDAIAFTSMAQVDRLYRVAEDHDQMPLLQAGLARTQVAAVGPVVADALRARGAQVDVMPGQSWYLKPLTQALADGLQGLSAAP
ncbi:MAG: uroporphyrinogen III synthase HEM4 [Polycyclovorans sp.]|nr:uroporphyrinogen III synthase HEM4 [Polycyclovorans sp.]|tara:strand:- start:2110 stop:2976 length:867 start_codon:yes stop_codon:yes gene_type:complete